MVNVLAEVLPLALLDSLSLSTLVLPLWFLSMRVGLRTANVYAYLAIVATGYLVIGCALLAGASVLGERLRSAVGSPAGDVLVAALGGGLILVGAWHGLRRPPGSDLRAGEGRLAAWREAAVGESAAVRGLLTAASVSVLLELPTMLPYLVAVEVLDGSGLSRPASVLVLAVYCAVMVAPAALLTGLRSLAGHAVLPILRGFGERLRRGQREDTAWLLAILGVLLLSSTGLLSERVDWWPR